MGALARRAEDIFNEQNEGGRDAVRQMFLRLVTFSEDAEESKRRVSRSELLSVATDEDIMDDIIDTYAAYRLLTLDHDPATRSPTVELAHEALIREWERLRIWLDDSRYDLHQQRLLAAAVNEWIVADKDSSYLLHGARLEQFTGWATETELALTRDEREFLDASIARQTYAKNVERQRQQHELELAREAETSQCRAANRLRYLVVGLVEFLIVAVVLAALALNARTAAEDQLGKAEREAATNRSLVLAKNAEKPTSVAKRTWRWRSRLRQLIAHRPRQKQCKRYAVLPWDAAHAPCLGNIRDPCGLWASMLMVLTRYRGAALKWTKRSPVHGENSR